jgi:hypothetical protein
MTRFGALLTKVAALLSEHPVLTVAAAFTLVFGVLHQGRMLCEGMILTVRLFKDEVLAIRATYRRLVRELKRWDAD